MGFFKVPVIAVFTKFDQFKREIKFKLEDGSRDPGIDFNEEVERLFREHYQASLGESPLFVRLESEEFPSCNKIYNPNRLREGMHIAGKRCTDLIEMTANALSGDVVALMLLATQKDSLELSINQAIQRYVSRVKWDDNEISVFLLQGLLHS
jgi:hypothetical protein